VSSAGPLAAHTLVVPDLVIPHDTIIRPRGKTAPKSESPASRRFAPQSVDAAFTTTTAAHSGVDAFIVPLSVSHDSLPGNVPTIITELLTSVPVDGTSNTPQNTAAVDNVNASLSTPTLDRSPSAAKRRQLVQALSPKDSNKKLSTTEV
jgi:hypothetical protein